MMIQFAVTVFLVFSALADPIDEWTQFKRQYKKKYDNDEHELHRMSVFLRNKNMIDEHNSKFDNGLVSFALKLNHLGDLENHEIRGMLNGLNTSQSFLSYHGEEIFEKPDGINVPSFVDWRKQGAVTPVKDQKQCASCWAFSATGSLESHHFLKTNKLVSLSEQNLMDCSTSLGNNGCSGGSVSQSYKYVKLNKGIDTESSYRYTAKDGKCKFSKRHVGTTVTGYVRIQSGDEEALKLAVATKGPISISLDATQHSFHFYHKGVYNTTGCSTTVSDHCLLVVGYGSEGGKDYWLVKNSWGANWGEEGYIKISRNANNLCGIATWAVYPLV